VRTDKKSSQKADRKTTSRAHSHGVVGYSKKSALLEEAITHMNTGKYGRSSAALKELLTLDPHNTEARRLFATLHLRLGSLVTARQAFESLANEAIGRQDLWLAESLLREYLVAGPRCVPFLELLAHVYEEKGDTLASVAELGKAIDILLEDPDSENSNKPSQLYAKVRELAPASPSALQFASLFDIQTGELRVPYPSTPTGGISLGVDALNPQNEVPVATEEARVSDVMSWEQFDGALPNQEIPSPILSNPVIESLKDPDIFIGRPSTDFDQQAMDPPSFKPTGPIDSVDRLDQDIALSIVAEPRLPSSGHYDDELGEPIAERSSFVKEELHPNSSGESPGDTGEAPESPGLTSLMPWEQVESSTIKIEETDPSKASVVQSEQVPQSDNEFVQASSVLNQIEAVPDQLNSPVLMKDLTEPSESVFAVGSSPNPTVLLAPEVPILSVTDSSPTAPFSWNTVFDGAIKFIADTIPSSLPAALSKSEERELDSVQPDSVPEAPTSLLSAPTSEPLASLTDHDLLPVSHLSILSETTGSIVETTEIKEEAVLPQPTESFFSGVPSEPGGPSTLPTDAPSSFKMDVPSSPLSERLESPHEPEPPSFSHLIEPQPVAPSLEASGPESSHSAVIPEAPFVSEPASAEHREIPLTLPEVVEAPSLVATPSDVPSSSLSSIDTELSWSTGEVDVQTHRPSEKKRNWDKEKGETSVDSPVPLPPVEERSETVTELSRTGGWESATPEAIPAVEAITPIVEKIVPQEDTRPEWVQASESITFVSAPSSSSAASQDSVFESVHQNVESTCSVAASAVDVLFDSTGEKSQGSTRDRMMSPRPRPRFAVKMARARIGISSFIGSCFSTTRSIVLLCVGLAFFCVVLVAVAVGAVGLAWMAMEAPPSPTYHNLTASPPQILTDSKKNGYFLLLGFDVSGDQDPLQAGYERKVEAGDLQAASACMLGDEGKGTTGASGSVARGWFTSADPVAQLKPQSASVRAWAAQESLALKRYRQWLSLPFEDAGYGNILSPNCAHILLAHRLYLAEGFTQDFSTGLERLENDIRSWRIVLGQSKTLMVKMLAVTAVQDDVAIASGLLVRQDIDETTTGRLAKIVRPLDQVESSLRWPMQSYLVWATKDGIKALKNDKSADRPLYVALAAAMPLPVQQRSNAYADYYEAASKAVMEGRYTNLPKRSSFIRTPAVSVVDYVVNPIEHIIEVEPLPEWDHYVGRTIETDARLRLASLQVWIRQGPQDGNVISRLAKAGQAHYDPFTGLPMLVDQQKGVMYSVGQDGKDQEGDPQHDVVATIPKTQSTFSESSRSASSLQSR
jgi:hypothetical protein